VEPVLPVHAHVIFDRTLAALLEDLARQKNAATDRPRATSASPGHGLSFSGADKMCRPDLRLDIGPHSVSGLEEDR